MDAALRPNAAVDSVYIMENVSPTGEGVISSALASVSSCLRYFTPYCPVELAPDRVVFLYGIFKKPYANLTI